MNRDILKENRIHGDPLYPLAVYPIYYAAGSHMLDCHWHNEMEFLVVTKGKALFQINTVSLEVSEGEAVFINSGELHGCYPAGNFSLRFSAVVFKTDMLFSRFQDSIQERYIDPMIKKQYAVPIHIKPNTNWGREVLEQLFHIIEINAQKPFAYELSTKAHLLMLFSILFSMCSPMSHEKQNQASNYKVERLKQILTHIHTNYNEKLRLSELADKAGMSEGHFCRFFKEMMKKTTVAYINSLRVNAAAQLLVNTNKKIVEIAMDVGFDTLSYFIGIFKQQMLLTPSQYRRSCQKASL